MEEKEKGNWLGLNNTPVSSAGERDCSPRSSFHLPWGEALCQQEECLSYRGSLYPEAVQKPRSPSTF